MNGFHRIQNKLLVAILVVVLLPLIGTALYGNWITSDALRTQALSQARIEVTGRAQQVEDFLDHVHEDVLFLGQMKALAEFVEARTRGDAEAAAFWQKLIQDDFLSFSLRQGIYDQIRFIDETGQEIIRIDSDGHIATALTGDDLQNKSHRYYFDETMRLKAGDVFVSALDLNREYNEIEHPYQPVIRYATPVVDGEGDRRGIVVVNVFADGLLDLVRSPNAEDRSEHESHIVMVDQDGHYVIHTNREMEWGGPHDLGTGYRLAQDYPQSTDEILSGWVGAVVTDRALVYAPAFPDPTDHSRFLVVVYDAPGEMIFSPVRRFRFTAASILVLATVIAAAMSVLLARNLTAPIRALQEGVDQLTLGKLDRPVEVSSSDEIGELAAGFNHMADELAQSHHQQQLLLERLITVQEEERRLVAYDIHDGLIQRLVGARMQLSNYMAQRGKNDEIAARSLERTSSHLQLAIREGRQLVEGLRPTVLDDFGLAVAVSRVANQVAADVGCTVDLESNLNETRLPQAVEVTAFRVAQEALNNVRKHAQADHIHVEIWQTARSLTVTVQDQGIGFDATCQGDSKCVGLTSMRERARLLGGQCRIDSIPGVGTTIRVILPLSDELGGLVVEPATDEQG